MAYTTIKKYVGITGDYLSNVWQTLRAEENGPEAQPPVGARNEYPGAGGMGAVAGIPIGTLIMIGLAWFFLKGK